MKFPLSGTHGSETADLTISYDSQPIRKEIPDISRRVQPIVHSKRSMRACECGQHVWLLCIDLARRCGRSLASLVGSQIDWVKTTGLALMCDQPVIDGKLGRVSDTARAGPKVSPSIRQSGTVATRASRAKPWFLWKQATNGLLRWR